MPFLEDSMNIGMNIALVAITNHANGDQFCSSSPKPDCQLNGGRLLMKGLNTKEMLTLREARELLKISRNTMYHLIRQGDIPARKVGSSWRIVRDNLESWMDQQDNKIIQNHRSPTQEG